MFQDFSSVLMVSKCYTFIENGVKMDGMVLSIKINKTQDGVISLLELRILVANFSCLREDTAHQKKLGKIRELMYEFLAEKGYGQVIIKEDTRHQKDLLDHIYTAQMKHVANVYNRNIHGHDHNAIGINIRMDRAVFKAKIITVRNYDKADADHYDQIWTQSNPAEVWSTTDIGKMIANLGAQNPTRE